LQATENEALTARSKAEEAAGRAEAESAALRVRTAQLEGQLRWVRVLLCMYIRSNVGKPDCSKRLVLLALNIVGCQPKHKPIIRGVVTFRGLSLYMHAFARLKEKEVVRAGKEVEAARADLQELQGQVGVVVGCGEEADLVWMGSQPLIVTQKQCVEQVPYMRPCVLLPVPSMLHALFTLSTQCEGSVRVHGFYGGSCGVVAVQVSKAEEAVRKAGEEAATARGRASLLDSTLKVGHWYCCGGVLQRWTYLCSATAFMSHFNRCRCNLREQKPRLQLCLVMSCPTSAVFASLPFRVMSHLTSHCDPAGQGP
jgi:hypothetical protein